jgi:hypothetical protein
MRKLATNHSPFAGKGASAQRLPHRFALTQLTKGDPSQRTLGNYAKLTPTGMGAEDAPPTMFASKDTGV